MSAPTIAVTPNASVKIFGTTSVVTWFVRSATGGRGKRSSPSVVIAVSGFKVRVTISGGDLTVASTNGYDRLGIGVPKLGFGSTGPFYEYTEIAISSLTTVDGVANSYELDYSSAELEGANLAPIDDDPPPPAVFGGALEDVVFFAGAYGDSTSGVSATSPGTAVVVSIPVFIESFPPDNILFLPGAPTGVLPVPSGGFAFISGLNFLCGVTYTGGSPALSLQTLWATVGVASQSAMFLGEGGRLVAFSNGKRGIVRMDAEGHPESAWAADIADYVSTWTPANVVGGRDNDYSLDVFCHNREAVAYNSQLQRWCTPLDFSNTLTTNEVICAAIPVGGTLYLASRDTVATGDALKLWTLHGGAGTTADAYYPWNRSNTISDDLFLVETGVRVDNTSNPVTVEIFTNGDSSTVVRSKAITPPRTGLQHMIVKANERAAKSHRIHIRVISAGGDAGIESVRISGETSDIIY